MLPTDVTLTRGEAIKLNTALSRKRKRVTYLARFDCEMVYRLGSKADPKLSKVRTKEDDRPLFRKDRLSGNMIEKNNDIITYKDRGELYVLGKSGGISLFDGISPKLSMNKNDRWYLIPRNTPIPEGIIIAKDVQVDRFGQFHYELQPAYDMKLAEFQDKLAKLAKYTRPV